MINKRILTLQIQARTLANVITVKREALYKTLEPSDEMKSKLKKTPITATSIFGGQFGDLYDKELEKSSKQAMISLVSKKATPSDKPNTRTYGQKRAPFKKNQSTYKIPLKKKASPDKSTEPPAKKKRLGFRKDKKQ